MEIKVVAGDIARTEAGALILGVYESPQHPEGVLANIDKVLNGAIAPMMSRGEIKGKLCEITVIYTLGKLPASILAIVGLGKAAELTLGKIRDAVAEACRALQKRRVSSVAVLVLGTDGKRIDAASSAQMVVEGAMLGTYSFRKYLTGDSNHIDLKQLTLVGTKEELTALSEGAKKGEIVSEATNLARDMANEPSNYKTPRDLAESARTLAYENGIELTVLEEDKIKELGMGALLGVARGSAEPPRFMVFRYHGKNGKGTDIALVGKGITFDSGGISIKPADKMEQMKGDMAGGAAVMTAMSAIAKLKPKVNVLGVVAAAENLPGGSAVKPGDILKAMNGKTIEVISTDAEGRLTLADALCYALQEKPRYVLDIATLTGSCQATFNDVYSGGFTNNLPFLDKVIAAGADAGELIWQLPMHELYREQNKSDIADMRNTGRQRFAGAIVAAMFLSEFVGETPWVHLDIAGTDLSEKDRGQWVKGATGYGVRTLINLVSSLAKK